MTLPQLELMNKVSDQCRLTHPHPHCILTDQIFVSLLQTILKGERSKAAILDHALVQIVNRGDDSDTVGAVTGALCGAYYGIEGISERWRQVLRERRKIEELFKQLS